MWEFLERTWPLWVAGGGFWVFWHVTQRARARDNLANDNWWFQYRLREKTRTLHLAREAEFERWPDETEDQYIERFRYWLMN